jgi:hypothetical protein
VHQLQPLVLTMQPTGDFAPVFGAKRGLTVCTFIVQSLGQGCCMGLGLAAPATSAAAAKSGK